MRIKFGKFLIRLGSFIESLPVAVMKPDDLIEFSRQSYHSKEDVESWAVDDLVDSGLAPDELDLLADLPKKTGKLLLLGVGGGRDAIALAKLGFDVTGVDYVPEMVDRAMENARKRGVPIEGMVQEISKLDVPSGIYDVVWISRSMYSCIPTRVRRVEMVSRVANALMPGGYFLCQFHRGDNHQYSEKGMLLRKLIAALTLGNREIEPGDHLFLNVEFLHEFHSLEELRSEIEDGGLVVTRFQTEVNPTRAGAVCRKPEQAHD